MQINPVQLGNQSPLVNVMETPANKASTLNQQLFQHTDNGEITNQASRNPHYTLAPTPALVTSYDHLEKYCPGYQADPTKALTELDADKILELLTNLDKIGLQYPERTRLIREIVEKNPNSSDLGFAIDNFFSRFGIIEEAQNCKDISQRVDLCREFVANGGWAARMLTRNLKSLGLKEADPQKTLFLCREIMAQGEQPSIALAWGIIHLGLDKIPVPQQLSLFDEIMAKGLYAAEAFASSIGKLGLVGFGMPEKLSLYRKIIKQGDSATSHLLYHINELGLERVDVNVRLDLFLEVVEQGEMGAEELAMNFGALGLEQAELADRLALCRAIAARSVVAAEELAKNFDALGLELAELQDRLALCREIVAKGEYAARELALNYNKLGLESLKLPEKLALCREIVVKGERSADAFILNFELFGLENLKLSEKLSLLRESVQQSQGAAHKIVLNFANLGLREVEVRERLSLLRLIASRGMQPAMELAGNLDKLGLEEATFSEKSALFREIAAQSHLVVHSLIQSIGDLHLTASEKRQHILELLVPPHNLDYAFLHNLKKLEYVTEVMTIFSFIVKSSDFVSLEKFLSENKKLTLLLPIFNKIILEVRTKSNNLAQLPQPAQLAMWIAYTAGVFYDLEEEQVEAIKESGVLEDIFGFHNPQYRYALVRQLSWISAEDIRKMAQMEKIKKRTRLSWLPLSRLKQPGLTDENVLKILMQINGKADFKDTSRLNHLFQFLFSIIEEGPYEPEDMKRIGNTLENLLSREAPRKAKKGKAPDQKVIDMISKDLLTLTNIVHIFGREEFLSCLRAEMNYGTFFLEKFRDIFSVEKIEDIDTRYMETFGSFRNKTALITYLRSVRNLPAHESEKVFRTLSAYVNAVLKGNFPDARYDTENNPHLKFLFEGREGLKEAWLDHEKTVKITKSGELEPQFFNYKEFFFQKMITDRHLIPEEFPLLHTYLQGNINTSKLENKAHDPIASFQLLAIDLCENRITVDEFIEKVDELKPPLGEFQNDLKILKPQQTAGEFISFFSDDPCDLLLIGTEINGSCQRVDGDPHYNKCLASYLMNGEIIPIVVKREGHAELFARSMLRLMWDDKNKTQVLLLERIYSNAKFHFIENAIQRQAELKAEKMGIPLVSTQVGEGDPYDGLVECFGGYAHYTYSDASGGVMEGAFKTEKCHVLYAPEKS